MDHVTGAPSWLMAWEWVTPIATTLGGTSIGLAGIAATVRAAKDQRELLDRLSQREQEHRSYADLRALRQEIYAEFVRAAYETIHATDEQIDQHLDLYVRLHQVQTVASTNVANFAVELFVAALNTRTQNGDLRPAEADYPGEDFIEAEQALVDAIRTEIQKGLPKGAL